MSRHCFKKETYAVDFVQYDAQTQLFASAFGDCTLKIWSLNSIILDNKSIEESATTSENAVEIAPVDVKFSHNGKRIAVTSIDSSIKVYDISVDSDKIKANLVVDSNTMQPSDGSQLQPWKVCFNPKNSDQLITGQVALQICEIKPN